MSDRMQQRRLSLPMELVWEVVVCIPADHVIRIKRSGPAQSAALNFMIAKFHRRYFVPSTIGPVMDFVRKLKRFGEVLPAIRPIRQYQQIVGVDGLFTAIPIPSEESLECLYGLAISYERYFQSLREPLTSIQYTKHLHRTLLMIDDAKRELGAIIATQSIQANQAVHQYFVQLKGEANALGNQFSRAPTPSMDSSNTSPNTSNSDAQENHQPMDSTGSTMNTAAGGAPPPPNQMQQ